MPLDPAFVADCLYGEGAVLIDEILEVDRARGLVRARMPTPPTLPLTREQQGDPRAHPRHVAGALFVHATGILGFAHAWYVLDLRPADGWVGFGTHIHSARFRTLATLGPPVEVACRQLQIRRVGDNVFARYGFEFQQGQSLVYESEQSAIWRRVAVAGPA
jgi:hypothetical protein